MPLTGRNIYYDTMLSDFATRTFDVEGMGFVADQITGTVGVTKQSANYYVFDPSGYMKVYDDLRAPRTAANKVSFNVSTDTYYAENRALAGEIALEDLANQDTAINLRENTTKAITIGLRRAQEIRIANLATASGNPGTIVQLGAASNWDAVTSADVLGQVGSAQIGMWRASGMRPNTCLIDFESLQLLRRNERLLSWYKAPQQGQLSEDTIFRDVLQVPRVIVAGGLKDSAPKGVVTMNLSQIWGRICLFLVSNPGAGGVDTINMLTRFRWRNPELPLPYRGPAGNDLTFSVARTQYDGAGQAHVEVLETGFYQAEKVTGSQLGYLIRTNSG
jgi:hypothetical protein